MSEPILLRNVVIFRTHEPRLVEIDSDDPERPRRVKLGADGRDLGHLARNTNDAVAAGRMIPVRIRHPVAGYSPPVVGSAIHFRSFVQCDDVTYLAADLRLDRGALATIREHRRVSIERASWQNRRLQMVDAVALMDGLPGAAFGPLLDLPPLRLPASA